MPKKNSKSRQASLQPVAAFNTLASKQANIWLTTVIILVVVIGLIALFRNVSVDGTSSSASGGSATIKVGESYAITDELSVKLLEAKPKCWLFLRSNCTKKASATVAITGGTDQSDSVTLTQNVKTEIDTDTFTMLARVGRGDATFVFFEPQGDIAQETTTGTSGRGTSTPTTTTGSGGIGTTNPNPGLEGGPTKDWGTTTPPSADVSSPIAGATWPACSLQTIKWNKAAFSASAGIGIHLLQNGVKVDEIAWPKTVRNPNGTYSTSGGMLRNNGAFDYVVPCDAKIGTNFQVRILDQTGKVLGDSGAFSITARSSTVVIKNPTAGQILPYGTDYLLRWFPPKFADTIDIAVYNADLGYNGLGFIATRIPKDWIYIDPQGNGAFTWSISDNILPQANGNGPTSIVGSNIYVIIAATDRSVSQSMKVQVTQ